MSTDIWRMAGAEDPEWSHDLALRKRFFDTLAKTVAVDFDGVLHPYTQGWTGSVPDDEPPMPGAERFLYDLSAEGYRVIVFSTRCDHTAGLEGVQAWLEKWDLAKLIAGITHEKPAAIAYVDDRAVPFSTHDGWRPVLTAIKQLAAGRSHGAAQ